MISSSKMLAAFACALSIVSASTLNTRQTRHNAIYTPGLNELVPVGVPYKITWNADVQGLVNIYLLRGPTENLKVLSTIAEGIQNTGSYVWTPPTTLKDDTTHYGLNLTMPAIPGEFQYSTQFGISNKNGGSDSSSSSSSGGSGSSSTSASGSSSSGSASTTYVATTDVVVTEASTGTTAPTTTVGPFTNGSVSVAKPTAAPTSSVGAKTNGTTSAGGAKPSSGAVSQVGRDLGAVLLAFGAALMI